MLRQSELASEPQRPDTKLDQAQPADIAGPQWRLALYVALS